MEILMQNEDKKAIKDTMNWLERHLDELQKSFGLTQFQHIWKIAMPVLEQYRADVQKSLHGRWQTRTWGKEKTLFLPWNYGNRKLAEKCSKQTI